MDICSKKFCNILVTGPQKIRWNQFWLTERLICENILFIYKKIQIQIQKSAKKSAEVELIMKSEMIYRTGFSFYESLYDSWVRVHKWLNQELVTEFSRKILDNKLVDRFLWVLLFQIISEFIRTLWVALSLTIDKSSWKNIK